MARLRSVLGKFNGTMADITFSNWKGQNVAKQKVPDTNGSQSPAQVIQRAKFAALAKLSGTAGSAIRLGMKMAAVDKTEQNVFQSVNKAQVQVNGAGQAQILWEGLQFSQGQIPGVVLTSYQWDSAAGVANIAWVDNSNGADAVTGDKLVLIIVQASTLETYVVIGAANRQDKNVAASVAKFKGVDYTDLHAFSFFKRYNSTACSNTTNMS